MTKYYLNILKIINVRGINMNYQNIMLHDEFPFEYSSYEMNTPYVKKYSKMFQYLDLSNIPRYTKRVGRKGYDTHALIKALIFHASEGFRSILKLTNILENLPYFSKFILGFKKSIPDETVFYRFLKEFSTEKIREMLAQVNHEIYQKRNVAINIIALDSKPVKANTKHNNPKTFQRNLSRKTEKPKRNEEATLCYYSKSNDEFTKKETVVFYWGYRIHLVVDAERDIPLTFMLAENNKKDFDVALPLYTKLLTYYPELHRQNISQVADKGYYVEKVFRAFHTYFDGNSFIPRKKQAGEKDFKIPVCKKKLNMIYKDSWFEKQQKRYRMRFCCPKKRKMRIPKVKKRMHEIFSNQRTLSR